MSKDWQKEWNHCQKSSWTKEVIPIIKKPQYIPMNHLLTQAYTGHGKFSQYIYYKHKIIDSPENKFCKNIIDSPKDTLIECPRFSDLRPSTDKMVIGNHEFTKMINKTIGTQKD